ncbi:hypothetical protein Bbelb_324210 [Branchiostoma belcheri]|nr:hypothetical protein Bbelb_324210 [Branchiostoma belcheri]
MPMITVRCSPKPTEWCLLISRTHGPHMARSLSSPSVRRVTDNFLSPNRLSEQQASVNGPVSLSVVQMYGRSRRFLSQPGYNCQVWKKWPIITFGGDGNPGTRAAAGGFRGVLAGLNYWTVCAKPRARTEFIIAPGPTDWATQGFVRRPPRGVRWDGTVHSVNFAASQLQQSKAGMGFPFTAS